LRKRQRERAVDRKEGDVDMWMSREGGRRVAEYVRGEGNGAIGTTTLKTMMMTRRTMVAMRIFLSHTASSNVRALSIISILKNRNHEQSMHYQQDMDLCHGIIISSISSNCSRRGGYERLVPREDDHGDKDGKGDDIDAHGDALEEELDDVLAALKGILNVPRTLDNQN